MTLLNNVFYLSSVFSYLALVTLCFMTLPISSLILTCHVVGTKELKNYTFQIPLQVRAWELIQFSQRKLPQKT